MYQLSSLSLPDESWWSGSGEEQPLSGLFSLSLLCFLFGTVTYTRTRTNKIEPVLLKQFVTFVELARKKEK